MRAMVALVAGLGAFAAGMVPQARANDTAAAIAAGAVGLAVGAALANSEHHQHHNNAYGDSFSPKPGVICYPVQRACYHADGSFASHMTWEIYR